MKIIVAHYKYYLQGGPEKYLFKFIELAKSKGCQVIPFSVKYDVNIITEYSRYFVKPVNPMSNGLFETSSLSFFRMIKGAWNEFHNIEACRNLRKLIRAEKPDLVYVLIPGILSADILKVAWSEKVPTILRISDFRLICGIYTLLRNNETCEECIHGDYSSMTKNRCVKGSLLLSFLRAQALSYARRKRKYEYASAIIAPALFTKRKYIESGYFPDQKVHIIRTFIDYRSIEISLTHNNSVLCLGRLTPEKGFIYAVEAMQYLMDTSVKIILTGTKDNCSIDILQRITELNLEDRVLFAGFLTGRQLEEYINNAMCIACPVIWYENFPNAIIESYAYGKPVIASDIGSIPEMVDNGKTGYLFEPKNIGQIASCIRSIYEHPNLYIEMGKNARKKCEEEFSPDSHWNKFMGIYKKCKERIIHL
jgi:glycosyltransferase involved in cell wall biosynthesis